MIDYAKSNVNVCEVYVTGLSSGGGMTSVMCALYPNVFSGGSIMAGVPTGISTANIGLAMAGAYNGWLFPWGIPFHSPDYWGDQIREEHSPAYTGDWPKMISFQGTLDAAVDKSAWH